MSTNYEKGRSFEYRVKRVLEDAGYYVVRSASSQGVADLVGVKSVAFPLMVQCKHNCGLSTHDILSMSLLIIEFGIHPVLAHAWTGGPIAWYEFHLDGLKEMEVLG